MLTRIEELDEPPSPTTTGANAAKSNATLAGTYIQSSTYAQAIPIIYGTAKVAGNLIHLVDLTQTKAGNNKKASFKGLGSLAGYNYNAAIVLGLCEGPINGVALAWKDRDAPGLFSALDGGAWTLFTGTGSQSPWSYMTTNHPTQAVPYQYLAYTALAGASLPSGNVSAYSWLVQGFLPFGGSFRSSASAHVTGGSSTTGFNTNLGQPNDYFDGGLIVFSSGVLSGQSFPVLRSVNAAGRVTLLSAAQFAPAVNDNFTIVPSGDASPSDVLNDLLTNTLYGLGLPAARIGSLTTFATYCAASGLLFSPAYDTQRNAADIVRELLEIANSALVWSDGQIKIIPYGDQAITGNGQTFTPNNTPVYAFTDDDYLPSGQDPVQVQRKRPADAFNRVTVTFEENAAVASAKYAQTVAVASDLASINTYGVRDMNPLDYRAIKSPGVAQTVAQLRLQREQAVRNTYQWRTGWAKGCLLEPMDLVTITDTALGLAAQIVRVTSAVELADDQGFEITAEDWSGTHSTASTQQNQNRKGFSPDTSVAPGDTTSVVFEGPVPLAGYPLEMWIANSGGINWGGCDIYISLDNVNFEKIGSNPAPANFGTLTANLPVGALYPSPDNVNTLSVDLTVSEGVLVTYSNTDWNNLVPLCYVGGEFLAYKTATLTSAYHYDLTNLYRGLYQTPGGAVGIGQAFVFCDEAVFKLPWPQGQFGQTVYFKFPSWNVYGLNPQSLAAAPVYTHVIGQVPQIAQAQLQIEITQVSSAASTAVFTMTVRDPLNAGGTCTVTPSFQGISALNNDTLGAPAAVFTATVGTLYQFTATLNAPFAGASGYAKFKAVKTHWADGYATWYTTMASQDAEPAMVIAIGNNQSSSDVTAKASAVIAAPSNCATIKWLASTSAFPSQASVVASGATVSGGGPFSIADLGVTLALGDTVYLSVQGFDSLGRFTSGTFIQGKKTRETLSATKTIYFSAANFVPVDTLGTPGGVPKPGVDYSVDPQTGAIGNINSTGTIMAANFVLPDGATITSVACELWQEFYSMGILPEYSQGFVYASGAAAFASLQTASASAAWVTLTASVSQTTTGKRFTIRHEIWEDRVATPNLERFRQYAITYTPSNTQATI